MTTKEIMKELESYSDAQTKKTLMRHGAKEPLFGVKVADLKKILKKTKKNHELSLELYKTGNTDAMYLAGLMADEKKITKPQLEDWVKNAYWSYLNEFIVPWVASETQYGFELGQKWIKSKDENIAAAGWATLYNYANVNEDTNLDLITYSNLLDSIPNQIHKAPNRVKHTMNAFIISVGTSVNELTKKALDTAEKVGIVTVDMGDTACKEPNAKDYINKIISMGRNGKKKKTARC